MVTPLSEVYRFAELPDGAVHGGDLGEAGAQLFTGDVGVEREVLGQAAVGAVWRAEPERDEEGVVAIPADLA